MGEEVESPTGVRSARQSWRQVIRQGSRRRRGRPLRIPRQSHRSGGRTLTLGPACNCRNHSILCTSGSVSDLNKSPRDNRRRGRLAKQVAGCPKTGRDDVGVPLAQGWGLRVIHHAAGIPGRPRTSGREPAAVWIPNAICPGRLLAKESARVGRWVGGSGEAAACSLQELTDEPHVAEGVDDGALQHPFYRMRADRGARVFPHARRHGGTEMHGEGNRQRSRGASVRLRVSVSALLRDLRLLRDLNAIIRHFIQPGTTPQAASIGTPDFP